MSTLSVLIVNRLTEVACECHSVLHRFTGYLILERSILRERLVSTQFNMYSAGWWKPKVMHTDAVCDTSPSFSINHKPTEKKTRQGGNRAAAMTKVMSTVCTSLLTSVSNTLQGWHCASIPREKSCQKNQECSFWGVLRPLLWRGTTASLSLINYNSIFVLGLRFMRYCQCNACLSHQTQTNLLTNWSDLDNWSEYRDIQTLYLDI